jgi:hypothetical protein
MRKIIPIVLFSCSQFWMSWRWFVLKNIYANLVINATCILLYLSKSIYIYIYRPALVHTRALPAAPACPLARLTQRPVFLLSPASSACIYRPMFCSPRTYQGPTWTHHGSHLFLRECMVATETNFFMESCGIVWLFGGCCTSIIFAPTIWSIGWVLIRWTNT